MARRRLQRGEGKLGCVVWLLVLLAFGYVAYQLVPVLVKGSELEGFMVRQAESGIRPQPEKIAAAIVARAQELELPVEREDVEVIYRGGRLKMHASYVVPIDLMVTSYDWSRRHSIDRPVFNY